ncbi:ribonuclease H-like protein [Armillaria solidipes]|uniref:ribonuclease H n=1 Tax=Armillaria solidipes TaxID=1076256 RepID=A0A2H3C5N1_9AGAR|nr:ribonuclease H-like protein [Armillaria solidipes]
MDDDDDDKGVFNRRFRFCGFFREKPARDLITQCQRCTRYYAACCAHQSLRGSLVVPCHHDKLVFTDGACSNNGRQGATAGIGVVIGGAEECRWSIPIDDNIDPDSPRTSQRAELLAALEGLEKLREEETYIDGSEGEQPRRHQTAKFKTHKSANPSDPYTWVIVTDSEYVILGMTEYIYKWRTSGWRNSQGKRVANLDLFLKLDDAIGLIEQEGIQVGFWHIPRELNSEADELAKAAARCRVL